MSKWRKYNLGDISIMKYGKMPDKNKFVDKGYPVFSGYRIVGYYPIYNCNDGEVIVVARGVGGTGDIKLSPGRSWVTNLSIILIGDPEILDRKYFYYKFSQNTLRYLDSGSAQSQITIEHLKSVEIEIPSLAIQQKIASILSSFDDKIQLNRRMNQTLEQMAQALFNHYFVDNIDSDNLPEGWRWGTLGDIIEVKHGYAFKGKYITEEINRNILLTPGNFKIGGGFNYKKFKYYNGDIPKEYVLNTNDLIVTMTDLSKAGDTLGYPSLVPEIQGQKLLHNQRIGKVILKENNISKFFCYWLLRTPPYRNFILGSATGSTVKHTSPSRIHEFRCIIPSFTALLEFSKKVQALYQKELSNEIESSMLSNVRETLLPKLMSGEIDVDALLKGELLI